MFCFLFALSSTLLGRTDCRQNYWECSWALSCGHLWWKPDLPIRQSWKEPEIHLVDVGLWQKTQDPQIQGRWRGRSTRTELKSNVARNRERPGSIDKESSLATSASQTQPVVHSLYIIYIYILYIIYIYIITIICVIHSPNLPYSKRVGSPVAALPIWWTL